MLLCYIFVLEGLFARARSYLSLLMCCDWRIYLFVIRVWFGVYPALLARATDGLENGALTL